ncbi:uncharacterized protein LOC117895164 [Drosophila subobscura]|uniref:uncharacterized protein LOC117895164 n=1 Tax=Drosophila subobscura TaxID=7241 RepID=UPI00155B2FE5|nr:uncharacterized protein LOC117895164 [Drosophila subobscura]XP_034658515.1 uncharacterized protein LOC117895164 [Drosophila subobscura]
MSRESSSQRVIPVDTEALVASDENQAQLEMSQPNNASVLEAVRVIELVEIIPKYEGSVEKLDGFISAVEQILGLIKGEERSAVGTIALRAIRSKVIGAADRTLELNEVDLNWDNIKKALLSHFRDKRSEQDLIMELTHIKEKKLELEPLYQKVLELRKALVSLGKAKEPNPLLRREKTKWYEDMTLNAFLSAIKGPIGLTIRNIHVDDISKAYEIACRERNVYTLDGPEQGAKKYLTTENQAKETKEPLAQELDRKETQTPGVHRETPGWPQYQWGVNDQSSFGMPFPMNNGSGWPGFGFVYPMGGNPFRGAPFMQNEQAGYTRGPGRNQQYRNPRWGYDQQNNGRRWGQNNRQEQLAIQSPQDAGRSGQSRMSRMTNNTGQSYNSNNSRQSYAAQQTPSTSTRVSGQPAVGQLHNIQEEDGNFLQAASNKAQDT